MAAETAPLDQLREASTGTHAEYRNAEVDLVNPAVTVTGDTARVTVEERTRLVFAIRDSADSAEAARYRVPHVLDFQRRGADWVLAADALDVPADSPDPIPYAHPVKLKPAVPRDLAHESTIPKGIKPNYPGAKHWSSAPPASVNGGVQIDRPAAVAYARKYAIDYNQRYERFTNDCTNFVSQALRAGGWSDVGHGDNAPDQWWEYLIRDTFPVHSNTWTVAQSFADFGYQYSHRLRGYAGEAPLPADVILTDWENGSDGHIDHAIIITENQPGNVDDWSKIKVTYHSNDQDNIPLSQVRQKAHPQTTWYFADTRGF
ncbi:amidase domain-containing protein [Amycolatopsis sp. NPDC059021]|uniref:amidase domain-containing protein n=1 Tax=Amycolatopsis sp. NPDC059021 TaxID=3346704 RepID=UPI00366DB5EB